MLTDEELNGLLGEIDALYAEQEADRVAYHAGSGLQRALKIAERLSQGGQNQPLWNAAMVRASRLQMG